MVCVHNGYQQRPRFSVSFSISFLILLTFSGKKFLKSSDSSPGSLLDGRSLDVFPKSLFNFLYSVFISPEEDSNTNLIVCYNCTSSQSLSFQTSSLVEYSALYPCVKNALQLFAFSVALVTLNPSRGVIRSHFLLLYRTVLVRELCQNVIIHIKYC